MAKPAAQTKPPESRSVATTPKGAIAEVPEYMRGKAGQGTEGVGAADVALPLIKLAQAISPELDTIDGLKAGDFFHTVTEDILGPELTIVMVYCDIRAMLWRPRKSGGGLLARSEDLKTWNPSNAVFDVTLDNKKIVKWATKGSVMESRLLEFGTSDPDDPQSQPAGTRMYNLAVMLPDYPQLSPSIVTNQRSQIRPVKNLLGKMKMSRAPSWGQRFKLQSVEDQGPSGPFFNVRYIADGFVTDPQEGTIYEEFYKKFLDDGVRIREEDLEQASSDVAAAAQGSGEKAPADRPGY